MLLNIFSFTVVILLTSIEIIPFPTFLVKVLQETYRNLAYCTKMETFL